MTLPQRLLVILVLLHGALMIATIKAPTLVITLDPSTILHVTGFSYRLPLTAKENNLFPYQIGTGSPQHFSASRTEFLEAHQPFGTSLSPLTKISTVGQGKYTLWQDALYFSTSDNSDPRNNHRSYILNIQLDVIPGFFQGLLAIDLLLLLTVASRPIQPLARSSNRRLIMLLILMIALLYSLLWIQRPPFIIFSTDSLGYIRPVFLALSGEEFIQKYGRTFLYPGFVYLLQTLFSQSTAVIYTQWFLFLATVAILALSCRTVITPPTNRLLRIILLLAIFFLCWSYLAYFPQQLFVHHLLPEGLFSFMSALSVLLLLQFWCNRSMTPRTAMVLFVLTFFVTSANTYIKPHWTGAALITIALLIYRLGTVKNISRQQQVLLVIAAAALVFTTVVQPQKALTKRSDFFYTTVLGPKVLFCNHSDLILPVLGHSASDLPPEKIAQIAKTLQKYLDSSKERWPLLGFNGDHCVFNSQPQETINAHFNNDAKAIKNFYLRHFIAAIVHNPLAYLSKVLHQFQALIRNPVAYEEHQYFKFDDSLLISLQGIRPAYSTPSYQALVQLKPLTSGTITSLPLNLKNQKVATYRIFRLLNRSGVVLWSLILLTVLVDGLRSGLNSNFRQRISTVLIINTLYFSSGAVVATVHTFDIARYTQVMFELFLLSLFINGYYLINYWCTLAWQPKRKCRNRKIDFQRFTLAPRCRTDYWYFFRLSK